MPTTHVAPHGLHHVTAIATDPQRNVDFYTQVLGLRLVKQTVVFDPPHGYHLYYGDEHGQPTTLMTFFPWPGAAPGVDGSGMATATAFGVPGASLSWWWDRLRAQGVDAARPALRAAGTEEVIVLRDPDGFTLELVAADGDGRSGWDGAASVPAEHAVRGLHAITLSEHSATTTGTALIDLLGMSVDDETGGRTRFCMGGGSAGAFVDVVATTADRGRQAAGTVHHVAFRAPDLDTLVQWREQLVATDRKVTPVMDRNYFRSIYFREPGGVLFEIATDSPGFAVDEPLLELGRSLQLPPWLEPDREQITRALPPLALPPQEATAR